MPKFQRRQIRFGLKKFTESLQVLKAESVGDLADRQAGGG